MSTAVPYHKVANAQLPSALGARLAINRYLALPYSNSILLSEQSLYVRVLKNRFKLILPIISDTADPAVTIRGKYAELNTGTADPWIDFEAVMGFGLRGEEVADPTTLEDGDLLIDEDYVLYRYPVVPSAGTTYYMFQVDMTLAMISELITGRISDLPDIVNDVSADENVIPQTIISGLEPMLDGLLI